MPGKGILKYVVFNIGIHQNALSLAVSIVKVNIKTTHGYMEINKGMIILLSLTMMKKARITVHCSG